MDVKIYENKQISKNGVFWLGYKDKEAGLKCNAYLIIDDNEKTREAVLIDPGSVLELSGLEKNLKKLIKLNELKHIILQHQDPDVCAAVPDLEKIYKDVLVTAYWRAGLLIKHYGIKSKINLLDYNNYSIKLNSGRALLFFHVPYAHSPGAVMTYDNKSKILFSGDLFGAFTNEESVYADDDYFEAMSIFHENYMPSKDIVNMAMKRVEYIREHLGIEMIVPQHGNIIKGGNIKKAVDLLKNLECGDYLKPIKKELINEKEAYKELANELIGMQYSVFGRNKWHEKLKNNKIIENTGYINTDYYSLEGINSLLKLTHEEGGYMVTDSFKNRILRIINTYGLPFPDLYADTQYRKGEEEIEDYNKLFEFMTGELTKLENEKEELVLSIKKIEKNAQKDKMTGLYNYEFFTRFIQEAHKQVMEGQLNGYCAAVLGIDNIIDINDKYGSRFGDEIIIKAANILADFWPEKEYIFKYKGPYFIIFIPNSEKEKCFNKLDKIRKKIADVNIKSTSLTLSVGIVNIPLELKNANSWEQIIEAAFYKLNIAKSMGGNRVIDELELGKGSELLKVLIVEPNEVSRRVLKNMIEDLEYKAITVNDGLKAMSILEKEKISCVLTEKLLPKRDGMYLLNYIKNNSIHMDIPVIFISSVFNTEDIVRAIEFGAEDYILKPYSIDILKTKIKKYL